MLTVNIELSVSAAAARRIYIFVLTVACLFLETNVD